MSKITVETKNNTTFISNRLEYPETVNERLSTLLTETPIDGLLPVSGSQKWQETVVTATAEGLTPVTAYLSAGVEKSLFVSVVTQIVDIVKRCEDSFINTHNLDLEPERVFVDSAGKVWCVLWPIINSQTSNPPKVFFQKAAQFAGSNYFNDGYLDKYKEFFDTKAPFSLSGFEKMLSQLSSVEASAPSAPASAPVGGNIEYNPFGAVDGEADPAPAEPTPQAPMQFCFACGTKLLPGAAFCFECGQRLSEGFEEPASAEVQEEVPPVEVQEEPAPVDLQEEITPFAVQEPMPFPPPEETFIRGESTISVPCRSADREILTPVLFRCSTNECFYISGDVCTIGNGRTVNDVTIWDNRFISRRHAEILVRGGRFYLVDKGSTNGTYVNGERLMPDEAVEVFANVPFCIANEDFLIGFQDNNQ